jgi:hypothetical protein
MHDKHILHPQLRHGFSPTSYSWPGKHSDAYDKTQVSFFLPKIHGFFFELILVPDRYSVGHLVVDSLASHFGIKLTNEFGGYFGQGNVLIGETELSLNLFKSSP